MEALKLLAGAVVGLGTLTIRWVYNGWETKAMRAARLHGLSMTRVAPPCARWGSVTKCDVWTILGAFNGGVFGFGLGWVVLDSVAVGAVISVAGMVLFGWRYRVVTSILAVADAAQAAGSPSADGRDSAVHRREDGARPLSVRGTRAQYAIAGAFCGVVIGLSVGPAFHQHGTTLVAETVGASAFLAWKFVQLPDRWRR